jgi:hypothetical protein
MQRVALREVLRAALRLGHESPQIAVHENVNVCLSPSPRPRLSCSGPVQRGGASRGDPEVGQSESWPEGQPEGRCGAWGCARKRVSGRPWVSVRPLKRVCHCDLAGRGQASGAKTPCSRILSGVCRVPGRTDQGFKERRGGTSEGVPRPLVSVSPGNMPRPTVPRRAFRRSASPYSHRGRGPLNLPLT